MKTFEIKGFWGFVVFGLMSLLMLSVAVTLPVSFVWVAWNAFVGEIFHGPMLTFWEAALLTAIIAVSLKIIFQPQISFQIKRIKGPDDVNKFNKQDSPKD